MEVLRDSPGVELELHAGLREPQTQLGVLTCRRPEALVEAFGLQDQAGLGRHVGGPEALGWCGHVRIQAGEPELHAARMEPSDELRRVERRSRDDPAEQRRDGLGATPVKVEVALDHALARPDVVADEQGSVTASD